MADAFDALTSVIEFIGTIAESIMNAIRYIAFNETGMTFIGFIFSVLVTMMIIRITLNFLIRIIVNIFYA